MYPNQSNTKRNRLIGALVVAIFLMVIFFFVYQNLSVKKSVTLTPTNGTTIEIGQQDEEGGMKLEETISKTTAQSTIRLNPGVYTIIFSGDGYESQNSSVNIQKDTEITTPPLKFTKARLDQLLQKDRVAIAESLQAITSSGDGYILSDEKLYLQGDWYAAKLVPGDSTKYDVLRVVAHKENGKWTAATPSRLVFYKNHYPKIPVDVLRDINNR